MKERVSFLKSSFKDFTGLEREVTICAVTKEDDYLDKVLYAGISIQNPTDVYHTPVKQPKRPLGEVIAEGKAKNPKTRLFTLTTENSGAISKEVVDAVMNSQMRFFQQAPERFIAGYAKDKELFENNPSAYSSKYNIPEVTSK